MHKLNISLITFALIFITGFAGASENRTLSPDGAKAYIIYPINGGIVPKTFTVQFGLKRMGVSPAGLFKTNTGHHHLLIDSTVLPAMDKPLGSNVTHFGLGQTETLLTLKPGKHTLRLILGDSYHRPHEPGLYRK